MSAAKTSTTRKTSSQIIALLNTLGFSFSMDELTDRVLINGRQMTDVDSAILRTVLRDKGELRVNWALDAVIANANENRTHPIREYLNSLAWDGGQYVEQLSSFFQDEHGVFGIFLRRWLIGAVRRVFESGTRHRMLVLDGPQEIGKSKFVEWLCPVQFRREHFLASSILPDLKDHRIALMTRWIWEVAELGSTTRRADREALKYFLSLEQVSERQPYGRFETNKPALSNFIGTVNDEGGLLSDPTGSTRFMFVKLLSIDWRGYMDAVTPDQVWSEAVMAYYAGESADLMPDESELASEINSAYKFEDPIESALLKFFKIEPGDESLWTPTTEIIKTLEDPIYGAIRGVTSSTARQLASVMAGLGCKRKRSRGSSSAPNPNPIWGYVGVERL